MLPVERTGRLRDRHLQNRAALLSTSSLLAFALIADNPAIAQPAPEGGQLPQVTVQAPRQPQRPRPARPAPRPAPAPAAPAAPATPTPAATTPLNSNAVAESASSLGLTARQTPATGEVINQETLRTQGHRTVSEVAQGAVGVTSGDGPGEPSGFSMRGF